MHDPSTLLGRIPLIRLDIWHDDPDGADAGTACGNPPMTPGGTLLWGVRHHRHLHYRWRPYLKVRRWLRDRCAECGRRFLWSDSRTGYMGSEDVYHSPCMSLRTVRGDLDDLTAHVRGVADQNASWRAKYRLDFLADRERDAVLADLERELGA